MSSGFYYEDGQGKIADEQGNEAMDYEEEFDPYNIITEELDTKMEEISEELALEAINRKYNVYSDKQKAVFYYSNRAKLATLHPVARNSAENREKRYQWAKKWVQITDMSFLENCVFVDEVGFNINMRSSNTRSLKGTPAVIETPSTRAISLMILGAITAHDVISIESREPLKPKKVKVDGSRKRKKPLSKASRKGTVTGYYMRFISKTLDEMDKFPEMRNFYIIMDNAQIHTSDIITSLIEMRETEDLKTRIAEAGESVSRKTLYNIANHSSELFKCKNELWATKVNLVLWKTNFGSGAAVSITMLGAISADGVIDISLKKPTSAINGKTVQINERVGTRSEHFLSYLNSIMDCLDHNGLHGYYM
ncbi:hypothetical protein MFLAVUS_005158 [Mucor flavus]|uniref:Transposase n=1 Tax=Mucor flavus TaxID=439312 RepID=A0ABP9YXZ3_9FUNG